MGNLIQVILHGNMNGIWVSDYLHPALNSEIPAPYQQHNKGHFLITNIFKHDDKHCLYIAFITVLHV